MPVPKEPIGPSVPGPVWSWSADDEPVIAVGGTDADPIITATPVEGPTSGE